MKNQEAENRRNQVDRYVNGSMSAEEVDVFEQRMRENVALAEEVHLHRDVLAGMNHYFNLDLKKKLQEEEERLKKKPINFYKWVGIAASIILVAVVAYFLLFTGQTNPQQLYAQYYQPYPNIVNPTQRSDNSTENQGLRAYEAGKYDEALQVFNRQMAEGEEEAYQLFYAGIASLHTGNEDDAVSYFQEVIDWQDPTFTNPAQWYLALTHLKTGETQAAVRIFEEIKASGNDYSRRAADILSDL